MTRELLELFAGCDNYEVLKLYCAKKLKELKEKEAKEKEVKSKCISF